MTAPEKPTTQTIDDFLLGSLDDAQVASFESRMQEDFDLAMAVSERIEFLDSIQRATHATRQPVEPASSRPSRSRKLRVKATLWLAGTAASICLVVGLLPRENDIRSTEATKNEADPIGQVADRWLVLLEEDASEESAYLEEIDLLPISTDDSWIGELAVQAYQDNEA